MSTFALFILRRCDLLLISTSEHDQRFNTLTFVVNTPEDHEHLWERTE
jgi:hypothetical protein